MSGQFSALARYYDKLNYNADYKKAADYIESVFALYDKKPELVLDLACGTGNLTLELSRRGYDMTGLDLSPDMLAVASKKKNPGKDILWINQDMRDFELYGTVDAVVCCFDSLNYIQDGHEIERCFRLVYNYLNPGGVFLFDVNTRYKFEQVYGNSDIILEKSGVLCAWRNQYNKKSGVCEFFLSLFVKQADGAYKRFDEVQREKYHGGDTLAGLAGLAGFSELRVCYEFDVKNKKGFERMCFSMIKR